MNPNLSIVSIVLGLLFMGVWGYGLLKPKEFGVQLKAFPRSTGLGSVLMIVATLWFIRNLSQESIADFESLKPWLFLLFAAVGVGSCIFVRDFLGARGAAVLMLLAAKLMVDTARWANTEWRLVIIVWAYVWAVAGIWITISPWRLRDFISWHMATPGRFRFFNALRFGLGLLVFVLGLTVFRTVVV